MATEQEFQQARKRLGFNKAPVSTKDQIDSMKKKAVQDLKSSSKRAQVINYSFILNVIDRTIFNRRTVGNMEEKG